MQTSPYSPNGQSIVFVHTFVLSSPIVSPYRSTAVSVSPSNSHFCRRWRWRAAAGRPRVHRQTAARIPGERDDRQSNGQHRKPPRLAAAAAAVGVRRAARTIAARAYCARPGDRLPVAALDSTTPNCLSRFSQLLWRSLLKTHCRNWAVFPVIITPATVLIGIQFGIYHKSCSTYLN